MTDNVVPLNCTTTLDIPVDRVLDAAKEEVKDVVIVIGRQEDGKLYAASSISDVGDLLVLLELAKRTLLDGIE